MRNILAKKIGMCIVAILVLSYILGYFATSIRNLNNGEERLKQLVFAAQEIKIGTEFTVINFYTERYLLGDCALFYILKNENINNDLLNDIKIKVNKLAWEEEHTPEKNTALFRKGSYKLKIVFEEDRYLFHFTDCRSSLGKSLYDI